MKNCPSCGHLIDEGAARCPSCGREAGAAPGAAWEGASAAPIQRFFGTVAQVCFHPVVFFRRMPVDGAISGPLAFALVTHWVGAAVSFLWDLVLGRGYRPGGSSTWTFDFEGGVQNPFAERVQEWLHSAGAVILQPFPTLVFLLVVAGLIHLAARVLVTPGRGGAPTEVRYATALRIVCFASAPAIFAAFPFGGGFISKVWAMALSVVGAREVYRVGWLRAGVVALFPILLAGAIIMGGVLALLLLVFNLLSSL